MSEEQSDQYSSPTSTQGLILRVVVIGALFVAFVIGVVWYASK